MRPPISTEPIERIARRAYSTPHLTRFGALRELTLGVGMQNACDNANKCTILTKTR